MDVRERESLGVEADGHALQCRSLEPNKLLHNVGDFRLPWEKKKTGEPQDTIKHMKMRMLRVKDTNQDL